MKKLLIILVILFLFNVVSFSQDQQQQPVAEENPMAKFMGIQWGSNVIDFITHFKYKYKKTKNGYYLSNFKLGPLIIEEIQLKFKSQKNYMKFKVKSSTTKLIMEENAYQYNPNQFPKPNDVEWYVNFADERLFFGYGTDLFAQDEIQVAEHPSLGSLRECLIAIEKEDKRFRPYTRNENSKPTPVLIRGIERRLKISVEPEIEDGRPFSIYGSNFRRAGKDMLRNACRVISPPTITNLIAMEAPKYGSGNYSIVQILDIFNTATTAFTAAKIESLHKTKESANIIIHTGNWGCGVYGGNKTLMALLQIISAQIVGIKYLIYHTYDPESTNDYKGALKLFNSLLMEENKELRIMDILTKIQKFGFRWNVPNGN